MPLFTPGRTLILFSILNSSWAFGDVTLAPRGTCGRLLARSQEIVLWPRRKLAELYNRALIGRKWRRIDWKKFEENLDRFRANGDLAPATDVYEESAAFFLAALERLPESGGARTFEKVLHSENWGDRVAAYRLLNGSSRNPVEIAREIASLNFKFRRKIRFSEGVSSDQIRRLMRELYSLNRVPNSGLLYPWEWAGRAVSAKVERAIDDYVDFMVDTRGIERTIAELGILADDGVRDEVAAFLESNPGKIMIGALSNLMIHRGYVGKFPRLNFPSVDAETVLRAWKIGKKNLAEELRTSIGSAIEVRMKTNGAAEIATALGAVVTMVVIYKDFEEEKARLRTEAERQADELAGDLDRSASDLELRLRISSKLSPRERIAWRESLIFSENHPDGAAPGDSALLAEKIRIRLSTEKNPEESRRRVTDAFKEYLRLRTVP